MKDINPIDKSKEQLAAVIEKIESDSSVGIDAQYTHAIILDYLNQITKRIERIEKLIEDK